LTTIQSLKSNEKAVLKLLLENRDYSFREMAKLAGLNEVSVRRLHNKLKQDQVFYSLNIPNFPALGYMILMLQRVYISSPHLIEAKSIAKRFLDEWGNCIDCHETYDGKILVRSVWKNADEFKRAHADFYRKFGTDWLQRERIEMIPLDNANQLLRIKDIAF
jgi:DNA-binding Lrp family transcriptional regulator